MSISSRKQKTADKRLKGLYTHAKTLEEYLSTRYKINTTTECWEWINSLDTYGYSHPIHSPHARKHKKTRAHQLSYICWVGNIPKDMCVLHKCDNRKCINPEHLFIGSHEDNRLDMMKKNRQNALSGEDRPNAKLTEYKVRYIRKNKNIKTCFELAKELNVDSSLICKVWRKAIWSKVC